MTKQLEVSPVHEVLVSIRNNREKFLCMFSNKHMGSKIPMKQREWLQCKFFRFIQVHYITSYFQRVIHLMLSRRWPQLIQTPRNYNFPSMRSKYCHHLLRYASWHVSQSTKCKADAWAERRVDRISFFTYFYCAVV